ncbi:flagellar basal body P-ring formation protein FlgA [Psychromonas sp. RZ5]|nr:flagellar basal body P-ring formation protein FlgA [Psychromonas sp. RZ5]
MHLNKVIKLIRFILFLISLGASYTFAESNYSKDIEKFAETLVFDKYNQDFELRAEQKLDIKATPISDRLKFKQCTTPLQGYIVGDKIKSKTSVKVSCEDIDKWDIYIRVKVQVLIPVVIAEKSLNKGEVLNENNIKLIYKPKSQVRGRVFANAEVLKGARLKKNVTSKKSIRHRDICYVCEGDKVTLSANQNGLVIKASGIALTDGNIGSSVKVKNSRTDRVVIGTVHALNEVYVTF